MTFEKSGINAKGTKNGIQGKNMYKKSRTVTRMYRFSTDTPDRKTNLSGKI